MVFWTSVLGFKFNPHRIYTQGPAKYWKRRRILRMSAHMFGRRWNCYSIALRQVKKALLYSVKGRKLKQQDLMMLRAQRVAGASEELGIDSRVLKRGLQGASICLDNHSLSDLAIWEPRTFKALSSFAWHNYSLQGFGGVQHLGNPPDGVVLKGMMKPRKAE